MKNLVNLAESDQNRRFPVCIAAVGVFDGVHRGHQQIIRSARSLACRRGGDCAVAAISFSPHPRQLLMPDSPPELLMTENQRVAALLQSGADCCGFINFSAEISRLSPEEFLNALKNNGRLDIGGICVGSNWRFGSGGRGNREMLAEFCRENNWYFDAVPELELSGVTISSSAIRKAVADGQLAYASAMLGRPVQLTGTVEYGLHIATEKLSAPTANLRLSAGILPPDGVYTGGAEIDGKRYPAALNIGVAPTFGNGVRRVEIHLIGFAGSLYGRELTVDLYHYLRPEKCFVSPAELKKQISADIEKIKADFNLQKQ